MDGEDATAIFTEDWCRAIQNDPHWEMLPGRVEVCPGDNRFLDEVLKSDRTIKAMQCFRNSKNEYRFLMHLGRGLTGNHDILHGGATSTILDAVMGATAMAHVKHNTGTATLKVDFKKPLPAASFVLCKAWTERIEGRRIWTKATVEDGKGKLYATGEAIFIKINLKVSL